MSGRPDSAAAGADESAGRRRGGSSLDRAAAAGAGASTGDGMRGAGASVARVVGAATAGAEPSVAARTAEALPAPVPAAGLTTPPRPVPADHPAFAGHFPGQPLLPGVLLLAEAMEALRDASALAAALGPAPTLAAAKFLAPVRPGDAIAVVLTAAAGGAVAFEVRSRGRTAASGRFVPSAAGGTAAP